MNRLRLLFGALLVAAAVPLLGLAIACLLEAFEYRRDINFLQTAAYAALGALYIPLAVAAVAAAICGSGIVQSAIKEQQ